MKRMLLFLAVVAFVLPLTWTSAQAQGQVEIQYFRGTSHPQRKIVRLVWRMTDDPALISIVVEHGIDNVNFAPIGEVPAMSSGGHGTEYQFWHVNPPTGINYYRLVPQYAHGGLHISNAIKVLVSATPIFSYPRPPGIVGSDPENPWSEAFITDLNGRPILAASQGQSEISVSNLPSGMYVLNAKYDSGWQSSTFVVNDNR